MQIEIRGERGEGKTTVAMLIAKNLRSLGFEVTYIGRSEDRTRWGNDLLDSDQPFNPSLDAHRCISVIDEDATES